MVVSDHGVTTDPAVIARSTSAVTGTPAELAVMPVYSAELNSSWPSAVRRGCVS